MKSPIFVDVWVNVGNTITAYENYAYGVKALVDLYGRKHGIVLKTSDDYATLYNLVDADKVNHKSPLIIETSTPLSQFLYQYMNVTLYGFEGLRKTYYFINYKYFKHVYDGEDKSEEAIEQEWAKYCKFKEIVFATILLAEKFGLIRLDESRQKGVSRWLRIELKNASKYLNDDLLKKILIEKAKG